jgi:hypothetical protein
MTPSSSALVTGKRDWIFLKCEADHDWKSIGGCNAGCSETCCCSVPVNVCSRCRDCDYGENTDAETVRQECANGSHRYQV